MKDFPKASAPQLAPHLIGRDSEQPAPDMVPVSDAVPASPSLLPARLDRILRQSWVPTHAVCQAHQIAVKTVNQSDEVVLRRVSTRSQTMPLAESERVSRHT